MWQKCPQPLHLTLQMLPENKSFGGVGVGGGGRGRREMVMMSLKKKCSLGISSFIERYANEALKLSDLFWGLLQRLFKLHFKYKALNTKDKIGNYGSIASCRYEMGFGSLATNKIINSLKAGCTYCPNSLNLPAEKCMDATSTQCLSDEDSDGRSRLFILKHSSVYWYQRYYLHENVSEPNLWDRFCCN